MLVVIIVDNHIKLSITKKKHLLYIFLPKKEEKIVFRFSKRKKKKKEISRPAHWRKNNPWKKTGQHYQEGERIIT